RDVLLPAVDVPGYHVLEIDGRHITLAVAPRRAPALPEGERYWGLAAQLYSLRRDGDGGIGDFAALGTLAERAAALGAAAVMVSPFHAGFAARPERASPYSPSTRLWRNALHADFGALPAGFPSVELPASDDGLIDWRTAGSARWRALLSVLDAAARTDDLLAAYRTFAAAAGDALRDHAVFEALDAHFASLGIVGDWRRWPADYHDPRSSAVAAFAREHARDVDFHGFAQWLAERSVARAQQRALAAGMATGIVADLAVGTDPGGSQAWSKPRELLRGVSVGAPPDPFNPLGQSWGITAFSPQALADEGFAPWLDLLRANLAHVGGLRIDHALGLMRLWLVPDGADASEGAYLRYPLTDLLRLLCLEAARAGTIVVGEDLGTVPDDFHARTRPRGLLGMQVFWFEREHDGTFRRPERWSRDAIAMSSTHDLPTVAGWWDGVDLARRAALDLLGEQSPDAARAQRDRERELVADALVASGAARERPRDGASACDAVAAHLGRTTAPLALLPLEDALGEREQPNLPGTTAEHPNWRRRLPADVDAVLARPEVDARLRALDAARRG
ncbi:MAG TPA: 4-alpha-glucanotransferase, partial [Xanthomonadales bacterium]|nr:4-alpha-glucanotransferase [Xanthomonadales bacterium]